MGVILVYFPCFSLVFLFVNNFQRFFHFQRGKRRLIIELYNQAGASTEFYLDSRLNKLERSTPTSPNIIDQSLKCSENKNSTLGQMGMDSYDCVTKQEKWFEKTVASTFFNTTTKIYLRDTFNGHFNGIYFRISETSMEQEMELHDGEILTGTITSDDDPLPAVTQLTTPKIYFQRNNQKQEKKKLLCKGKVWKKSWDRQFSQVSSMENVFPENEDIFYIGYGFFYKKYQDSVVRKLKNLQLFFNNVNSQPLRAKTSKLPDFMQKFSDFTTSDSNALSVLETFDLEKVFVIQNQHFIDKIQEYQTTFYVCFIDTNLGIVLVDFSNKSIKKYFNVAVDSFITVNDNDMRFVNRFQENGARIYAFSKSSQKIYEINPVLAELKEYDIPGSLNTDVVESVAVSLVDSEVTVTSKSGGGSLNTFTYRVFAQKCREKGRKN